MRVFGSELEWDTFGFPPQVHAFVVLVLALKQSPERCADLKASFGKIEFSPAARRALGCELLVGAGCGEISDIVERDMLVRQGGAAQHPPDA